jgi:hypothetical protein
MMIWSHLPYRMKEDGVVSSLIEVPSGIGYVDEVVHSTIFGITYCGVRYQMEFSNL